MGIPVVISENGLGLPVKQVDGGAAVMTIADNGFGIPVIIGDVGVPFVVENYGARISFSGSIEEGTATGRAVGTATLANPPEDIGTLTWSELGTGTGAALFAIDGSTGAVTNTAAIDYETATSYTYGIQVTDGVYTYELLATINVTNVFEAASLSALTLDGLAYTEATADSGTITGKTSGSAVTLSGTLPTGLTLDLTAMTWAWDGTGTASSGAFDLVETLADSPNSPRTSTQNWAIIGSGVTIPSLDFSDADNSQYIQFLFAA